MARLLRLEFPGAVYHVTARGNARQAIFHTDADRDLFLNTFGEVIERFRWLCHAYCLMSNHYHLLVETSEANLSLGMRHLNGVYTHRFNRVHGCVGHLLQGRFKSILVERDSHLLELARYVVLNPVRAKAVSNPRHYRWSSYVGTAGLSATPCWLTTEWILSQFAESRPVAQQRYKRFVAQGQGVPSPWQAHQGQALLGSDQFVATMRPILEGKGSLKEVPRTQRLAHRPALQTLLPAQVLADKRARDEALRRACLEYGYTMAAAGKQVHLHYSTVSKVVKGVR